MKTYKQTDNHKHETPYPTQMQTPPVNKSGESNNPQNAPVITGFKGLIVHVTWIFIGPLVLIMVLLGIMNLGQGWATSLDVLFFVFLGIMLACRWIDQRSGQAMTGYGEPATWADFRRYAVRMPIVAVLAWIAANIAANHFPLK